MIEIYGDISESTKQLAEGAWNIAYAQKEPQKAAEFLDTVVRYYTNVLTEREIEFLQFYFQMKMEMMKE